MTDWSPVSQALVEAAASETEDSKRTPVFPGAVLLVAQGGELLFHEAAGMRSIVPERTPLTKEMVFDVASLTKPLVTTTLVMNLVDRSRLAVDQRVSRVLQSFGTLGKDKIQIRHLLNHTAGYVPFSPYAEMLEKVNVSQRAGIVGSRGGADFIYNDLYRTALQSMPGEKTAYSDLGFILLAHLCETAGGGVRLDKMAERTIFQPLKLRGTGFIDLERVRRKGVEPVQEQIVPTAFCAARNKVLCGEVHDRTAYAMGGVAGHAGLFATAADVHRIAWELIQCWRGDGTLVSKETIRRFWTRDNMDRNSTWALGWDTPSAQGSSSGRFFGPNSVGHLAFTGCSLWIDPDRELEVILLTNRIHPSVENQQIREFRPKIHDLVLQALGYGS